MEFCQMPGVIFTWYSDNRGCAARQYIGFSADTFRNDKEDKVRIM